MTDEVLYIAEVPYPDGSVRFRFAHYPTPEGKWIRHGLFQSFYEDGVLASEGEYVHGLEEGDWKDFHRNGVLAAEGRYVLGVKQGEWKFFSDGGVLEEAAMYVDGEERKS